MSRGKASALSVRAAVLGLATVSRSVASAASCWSLAAIYFIILSAIVVLSSTAAVIALGLAIAAVSAGGFQLLCGEPGLRRLGDGVSPW